MKSLIVAGVAALGTVALLALLRAMVVVGSDLWNHFVHEDTEEFFVEDAEEF